MGGRNEDLSAERLLHGRDDALQRLAAGAQLDEVLGILVSAAEEAAPNFRCSVLLYDRREARLRHGAAPSLPEFYNDAIDGLVVGPKVGSCGAATYSGQRVIVDDVMSHPNWVDFRELARRVGFRACWSEPIRSSTGEVLGTYAMYYREPRSPDADDIRTIESVAQLAGVAIECRQGEAERAALAAQLRQQQKLDAIGSLASGVAHEINNPIHAIMNYAQLIQKIADPGSALANYSNEIFSEANRVATIVRQLLAFSRCDVEITSRVGVDTIVDATISLLGSSLTGDNITLDVALPEHLPEIDCRGQQIQQVIVNAITNARDALNAKYPAAHRNKLIRISAQSFERGGAAWIRITIEDQGSGVPPHLIERIFDPFFTTKGPGSGTGLGLSVSLGIVAEHFGTIRVESEPERYTRLHVELPVDRPQEANAAH